METKGLFRIKNQMGEALFAGEYETMADCARAAVRAHVSLRYADLAGADLTGADLYGADLCSACLNYATLSRASLSSANLSKASLTGATLLATDLDRADMTSVYATSAEFTGARLDAANLTGSNLTESNFTDAVFDSAILTGADLTHAQITFEQVYGCYTVRGAKLDAIKHDLWSVLVRYRNEIPALRKAIEEGRIDGSVYTGTCSCLFGTIARERDVNYMELHGHDANRPIERWFLAIQRGSTPENNVVSRITLQWVAEFQGLFA